MNNTDDQTLNSLKDLNASMREFKALLEDLISSRKADKLKYLRDINTEIKEFKALLEVLSESRKKDALLNGSNQLIQ